MFGIEVTAFIESAETVAIYIVAGLSVYALITTVVVRRLMAMDDARESAFWRRADERAQRPLHSAVFSIGDAADLRAEIDGSIDRCARLGRPFDLYTCVFETPGTQDQSATDQVAVIVAERLAAHVQPADLLIRRDQNEFVVIRERLEGRLPSLFGASLQRLCALPVDLGGDSGRRIVPLSRIGMAEYPKHGTDARSLLNAAARSQAAASFLSPMPNDDGLLVAVINTQLVPKSANAA